MAKGGTCWGWFDARSFDLPLSEVGGWGGRQRCCWQLDHQLGAVDLHGQLLEQVLQRLPLQQRVGVDGEGGEGELGEGELGDCQLGDDVSDLPGRRCLQGLRQEPRGPPLEGVVVGQGDPPQAAPDFIRWLALQHLSKRACNGNSNDAWYVLYYNVV